MAILVVAGTPATLVLAACPVAYPAAALAVGILVASLAACPVAYPAAAWAVGTPAAAVGT